MNLRGYISTKFDKTF